MLNFKKFKKNKTITFKKNKDKVIVTVKKFDEYTGKPITENKIINLIELENRKNMYEREIKTIQERLDEVNSLLNDIHKNL